MILYIIRHADPDYPNNTITAAGHLEAAALGERMAGVGLTHIYVSPLGRAIDTMRYTAERTGLPYSIEEWTQELGDLRFEDPFLGRAMTWDISAEVVRTPECRTGEVCWTGHQLLDIPATREAMATIAVKSDELLARHRYEREGGAYKIVRPNRDKIAVFCHGGFGLTWLAHLLEIPVAAVWCGFFLPPSSVTTILFDERSDRYATPRCIGLGDLSHLYKVGLVMQPSGIKANVE
jgi:broad specificity phosphatase PhoE